jgi:hypothetical protein
MFKFYHSINCAIIFKFKFQYVNKIRLDIDPMIAAILAIY